jgi:SAM-dependent methyltransferase
VDLTCADPLAHQLYQKATALQTQLEAIDEQLYSTIRQDINTGFGSRLLTHWLPALAPGFRASSEDGYDYLDDLVTGVLAYDTPAAPVSALTHEMVSYQPTPARHIFDLLARLDLSSGDILMDIGCGLGNVPLLTAACTSARAIGIEYEPAYVASARTSARRLNLSNVEFRREDARVTDLARATVFYLYTPFAGSMLHEMIAVLRTEAERREFRICTLGPCVNSFLSEDWPIPTGPTNPSSITVFRTSGSSKSSAASSVKE